MLQYKPVTKQDGAKLRRYYQNCSYGLCEYSVGTKLMWRAALNPAWTEVAGCLVVRNRIDGQVVFDYPVPGPEGDEDAALDAIEQDCLEQGIPLSLIHISNRRELAYLVVHSVLHLLGYDHLDEGVQKQQMRQREEEILAELGIGRGEGAKG